METYDDFTVRKAIERTSNMESSITQEDIDRARIPYQKMQTTNFLKATGILDAYENVVSSMVEDGWPSDQSPFDHAAYLVLKYQTDHADELAISTALYKKNSIFTANDMSAKAIQ